MRRRALAPPSRAPLPHEPAWRRIPAAGGPSTCAFATLARSGRARLRRVRRCARGHAAAEPVAGSIVDLAAGDGSHWRRRGVTSRRTGPAANDLDFGAAVRRPRPSAKATHQAYEIDCGASRSARGPTCADHDIQRQPLWFMPGRRAEVASGGDRCPRATPSRSEFDTELGIVFGARRTLSACARVRRIVNGVPDWHSALIESGPGRTRICALGHETPETSSRQGPVPPTARPERLTSIGQVT